MVGLGGTIKRLAMGAIISHRAAFKNVKSLVETVSQQTRIQLTLKDLCVFPTGYLKSHPFSLNNHKIHTIVTLKAISLFLAQLLS